MQLADKVAIVTGGAGGIGRGIVRALRDRRCRVAVLDRDPVALAALAAEEGVTCLQCDVTDPAQVARAVDEVHSTYGRIDALINNAGRIHSAPLFNLLAAGERKHSLEAWREVIDANLTSAFLMTAHVVEKMATARTKGVIVNISSVSARGNAGQSAYAAAKAGVNALTVTWARELGVMGIRCVAIAPGFVDTDSTRSAMSENTLNEWVRRTPLRRLGRVEEIAQCVVAAIENDFLTGTVIEIDGALML